MSWQLEYQDYVPRQEGLREALCTLGNGYFATRGAAPWAHDDGIHYPGTYLAGGYDRRLSEVGGRRVENEDLVNLPNWLPLNVCLEGEEPFAPGNVELEHYRQTLDMRSAVLRFELVCVTHDGRRTALTLERLVSMAEPNAAAQRLRVRALNWSGEIRIRSGLDGAICNNGVARYRELERHHLTGFTGAQRNNETVTLDCEMISSGIRIAYAARTRLFSDGHPVTPPSQLEAQEQALSLTFTLPLARDCELVVDKQVRLFTSLDRAIASPSLAARERLETADDFDGLLRRHTLAWHQLWRRFHIELTDGDRSVRILRLHILHLLQTVSPNTIDRDVGVPARGWHGEAYRGHIFWDELFIFPFLNLRLPELTRALLRYRFRRLGRARLLARQAGLAGAMFPWQSGSDGREETQILHLNPKSGRWLEDGSHLQRHINIAIAYNIWQYVEVTQDQEFLNYYGAEMLLEIARFWASLATYDAEQDRFHIRGVMGPDEYHERYPGAARPGLDDNAYTNLMTVWVLQRAQQVLARLPAYRRDELRAQIGLVDDELERWRDIAGRMYVPFHEDGAGRRIISQFAGYADLEPFAWDDYRSRYEDIQRLDRVLEAEGDTPNRYQASKQADVLMLFYLLTPHELDALLGHCGYQPLSPQERRAIVEYYLQRTSHGSTLSRVVHAWVLARLDRPNSWAYAVQALESDVADSQGGTTPEGIHLGAMAGTVDLFQRGYTGVVAAEDCLQLDPALPEDIQGIELLIRYRGHWLTLTVRAEQLRVAAAPTRAAPITLLLRGERVQLASGEVMERPLSAASDRTGC
ncbi:MAG: glycosyl hydrolase family 65 protein [Pseudomonadota bacterium]|nr:glycosyl hydrolase family 65 protein [Pseudomonadota bacterium]